MRARSRTEKYYGKEFKLVKDREKYAERREPKEKGRGKRSCGDSADKRKGKQKRASSKGSAGKKGDSKGKPAHYDVSEQLSPEAIEWHHRLCREVSRADGDNKVWTYKVFEKLRLTDED